MKRFVLFFLLISSLSWSQNLKFKYFDLGLPQTDLTEDFNLKIGNGNVIPLQINEVYYDQRTKRGSNELITTPGTKSYKTFDTNTKKVKAFNVVRNNKTTYYTYTYNSSGKLIRYSNRKSTFNVQEFYKYNTEGGFTKEISVNGRIQPTKEVYKKTSYGFISSGTSNKKFYFKGNLLEKVVANYINPEPSESLYKRNKDGRIIKSESFFATIINKYNSKGDKTFFQETSKRNGSITSRRYAYKYDKYGNWIIQVNLLDMSTAKGLPSFPKPTLREIKYSNGEITGTTDITKVAKDLVELRKRVKNANTNPTNQVATWKKINIKDFIFFINGKGVYPKNFKQGGTDKSILLFYTPKKELYILKNFYTQPINKILDAKKLSINTTYGYWYKKRDGSVIVFDSDGTYIEKSVLYQYAPNNIDVFYQGEGKHNKVVLKNYKHALSNIVYPAIAFSNYKPNNSNTNSKKVAKRSGKCLKGDCDNGYGEFKHSNGYMSEGFFKNGIPYGPMHVSKESINESRISFLKGSYSSDVGMVYKYYQNRFTEMIDNNKQIGIVNDSKERKSYRLNFKNGKVVSRTLLKEKSNTGCIVGNCYNGAGVYKYNSGSFYFGFFKNGKRHGFGKLDFKDGKSYLGEFDMNTYSGMGTYIFSKYNYYMGEFKNNTYNGQGVMYYNKNRYDAGNWKNGHYVGKSNVTNTTVTTNTNYSNNTKSFNIFDKKDTDFIKQNIKNSKAIANVVNIYMNENSSKTYNERNQLLANYLHSVFNINPETSFSTAMKVKGFNKEVMAKLPSNIQNFFRDRAKGTIKNYNKYINSKRN